MALPTPPTLSMLRTAPSGREFRGLGHRDSRMNTGLGRTFGAASGRLDSWELLVVENGLEWTERD